MIEMLTIFFSVLIKKVGSETNERILGGGLEAIKIVFFFLLLFFFVGLEKGEVLVTFFDFLSFTFGMRVCGRTFTSLTVTVIEAWLLLLWYGAMFLAYGTKLCHVLGGETGTYLVSTTTFNDEG